MPCILPYQLVIFIVTLYLKNSYWLCAMKYLTWYDGLNGARVYCQIEGCGVERTKEQACRASTPHRYYELHYNCPLLSPSIPFLEGTGRTLSCVAACAITLLSCEIDLIRRLILLPIFRPSYPSFTSFSHSQFYKIHHFAQAEIRTSRFG